MANQHTMSDEEAQLRRRARRRLIGAVTLVTVMVVALPMLLDGESRQSGQDISINIPSQGSSGDFASSAVPAPAQPKSAPAAPAKAAEPVKAPAAAASAGSARRSRNPLPRRNTRTRNPLRLLPSRKVCHS